MNDLRGADPPGELAAGLQGAWWPCSRASPSSPSSPALLALLAVLALLALLTASPPPGGLMSPVARLVVTLTQGGNGRGRAAVDAGLAGLCFL